MDILLEAWDELGDECRSDPWRLVIAGPCVEDPQLKSNGNVDFLGAVEHSRVLDLLGKASIAMLPSRAEALPMFVLEAMAAGCAVVATDVGGIQQLLGDSERGGCASRQAIRHVASALKTLMCNFAERGSVQKPHARMCTPHIRLTEFRLHRWTLGRGPGSAEDQSGTHVFLVGPYPANATLIKGGVEASLWGLAHD